jgi:hypothetical protein
MTRSALIVHIERCSPASTILLAYALLVLLTTLVACQPASTNQFTPTVPVERSAEATKGSTMNTDQIQLKLIVAPTKFSLAERQQFKIGIEATNQGTQVIDPKLYRVQLFINGEESMIWNETIGNGRREAKWYALPPHETVSMTWSSMGTQLFPSAGDYSLVLQLGNTTLEPITIHVLAK